MKTLLLLALLGVGIGAAGHRFENTILTPADAGSGPQESEDKEPPDLSTPQKRAEAVEKATRGELSLTLEELRAELDRLKYALDQEEN